MELIIVFALLAAVCFFLQGFEVKWDGHSWVWLGVGLLCVHVALGVPAVMTNVVGRWRK